MESYKKKPYDPKNDPIYPRRDWTEEDIKELLRVWRLVPSIHLISLILKRAPSAVQTQASRSGLTKSANIDINKLRKRWNSKDDATLKDVVARYMEAGHGIPIIDVAKHMGRSIDSTVTRIIFLYDDPYIVRHITAPKKLADIEREFNELYGNGSLDEHEVTPPKTDNSIERKCLSCGRMFLSPDRKRIWRCQICKSASDDSGYAEYSL